MSPYIRDEIYAVDELKRLLHQKQALPWYALLQHVKLNIKIEKAFQEVLHYRPSL